MLRRVAILMASGLLALAADQNPPAEQEPPEEDERLAEKKVYDFNPLQAENELRIGNFYYKKGSWRAAAQRYREATRWNADHAEAWLKLAQASEKLKDPKTAREAYTRYLELEPDSKDAARIRRKLEPPKK